MHHNKPVPLYYRPVKPRRICPVCGAASYSRDGIHPQCAQRQADELRMQAVKAAKKAAPPAEKLVNPLSLLPWHKRCPKCRSQIHVRKKTCDCGHRFD